MTVTVNDIKFYKSSNSGSSGGDISLVEITDDIKNNLFDDVLGDEGLLGLTTYKKIFLKNTNNSSGLDNVFVWLESNTPSPDDVIYISKCNSITGSNPTSEGQNYVSPSSKIDPDALDFGTIDPEEYVPVWVKRVVDPAPTEYDNNSVVIKISGNYVIT